jgi:DNA-binding NarL/FixJ family response regulator
MLQAMFFPKPAPARLRVPSTVMLAMCEEAPSRRFSLVMRAAGAACLPARAKTVDELLREYAEYTPDVLIVDAGFSELGGYEAVRRLIENFPAARVLMAGGATAAVDVACAVGVGAGGYVTLPVSGECLAEAVRSVFQGRRYIGPEVLEALRARGVDIRFHGLTVRELEVLRQLATGRPVKTIAERLDLSIKTVYNHFRSIRAKLGVETATEAVTAGSRLGYLRPAPEVDTVLRALGARVRLAPT